MFLDRLDELHDLIENCIYTTKEKEISHEEALALSHHLLREAYKVYIIGNGGSAGIASHFCVDLLNVAKIPALTLYDSNVMTCMANDLGYEEIFSRPLQTLMQEEDLLVAISSSGQSVNICNAVEVAKKKKAKVMTFSGFESSNPLRKTGDLNFWLEKTDYGLVEMGHFFLLHTIIDAWNIDTTLTTLLAHANKN